MSRRDDSSEVVRVPEPVYDAGPAQVLVVEDSKEIREIIVWLLRMSGYRALAAENGFAAQLLLTASHPLLILSDLDMPWCDGWELLTFCHTNYPQIPVMVIAGGALGKHPEVERWAAGFLPQPFDSRKLQSEVKRLMAGTEGPR